MTLMIQQNQQAQTETVEPIVPVGYKQTEVGVIPEDWGVCELEDAVEFLDGSRRPIKSGDRAKISGIYPYYGASGIVDYVNDYIFDGDFILLGEDGENILSRNVPLAFRVIGKIWVNNHAHVLKPKHGFDIVYLTAFLESIDYSLLNSGTAQPKLNKKACLGIKVVKPSSKEQTAIANALSDVDALIGSLEALIAKKQTIKTATMQQLLTGRTRLPQFAKHADGTTKGYKTSELGEIPEDWGIKCLSQLATIRSGGTPSTMIKKYWDGTVDWCTPTDITALRDRKYLANTSRKISEEGVAQSAAEVFPSGTVVMTSRATIGECAIATVPMTTNQGFKNFLCGDDSDNEFIYYLLGSSKDRFISLCGGSTFLEISTTQVRNFNVAVPCKEEQTAIATILSDMDKEIQALEQRLTKTRDLKQGMMQQLLTGKIRLVPAKNESGG